MPVYYHDVARSWRSRRLLHGGVVVSMVLWAPAIHAGSAASMAPPCTTGALSLSLGPQISSETGEHGLILRLTNHAKRWCTVSGYPGVSFYAHHRLLPFRSLWGGRYGTGGEPMTVPLRRGARASFVVAKYRCDAGTVRTASEVRVYPPNSTTRLRLALRRQDGVSDISYCRRGVTPAAADDPGNTLNVSPVSRALYPYTPG